MSRPAASGDDLGRLAVDDNWRVRSAIASRLDCPPHLIKQAANDSDRAVRTAAIRNPSAPPHLIESAARDADTWIRAAAASNPSTPPHLLDLLASDPEEEVVSSAAKNPEIPPGTLARLASKPPSDDIMLHLAENPGCPLETVEGFLDRPRMRRQTRSFLHGSAGRRTDASERLLRRLGEADSHRDDYKARASAARHPNCPVDLLGRLAVDTDMPVRTAAAENPNCTAEMLERIAATDIDAAEYDWHLCATARHQNCPPHLHAKLASHKADTVRAGAAGNPSASADTLEKLAEDRSSRVRSAVAANPSCPAQLLEKLAREEGAVAAAAAANPNCTAEAITHIASTDLRAGAVSNLEASRELIARHPNCPPKLLEKLADDDHPQVRAAAAAHLPAAQPGQARA